MNLHRNLNKHSFLTTQMSRLEIKYDVCKLRCKSNIRVTPLCVGMFVCRRVRSEHLLATHDCNVALFK
jgi:hypothetical protein